MPSHSSPPKKARRGTDTVASRKGLAPSKIVVPGNKGVKISRAVTIRKPADALYAFWRDLLHSTDKILLPIKDDVMTSVFLRKLCLGF